MRLITQILSFFSGWKSKISTLENDNVFQFTNKSEYATVYELRDAPTVITRLRETKVIGNKEKSSITLAKLHLHETPIMKDILLDIADRLASRKGDKYVIRESRLYAPPEKIPNTDEIMVVPCILELGNYFVLGWKLVNSDIDLTSYLDRKLNNDIHVISS